MEGDSFQIDTSKENAQTVGQGARGDNATNVELLTKHMNSESKSKMNPDASIEIRDTEHFFYRLDFWYKNMPTKDKGFGNQMSK